MTKHILTPIEDRHEAMVDKRGPDECWPWTGALHHGHGVVSRGGQGKGSAQAHRVAYEKAFGPIPESLVVDHDCHNTDPTCAGGFTCLHRRCQNPRHLSVKTRGANVVASLLTITGREARMTHCHNGHEFTDENTYLYRGMRFCQACRKAYMAEYHRTHPKKPRLAS
jgi:hypothetical protein